MFLHDLFWLVTLHFVADFHLQSDFVATHKLPGRYVGWPWVMTAHAALHGAVVAFVLDPYFGVAEFIAHWLIDYAKARGVFGNGALGLLIDQFIHIGLKLVWLLLSRAA